MASKMLDEDLDSILDDALEAFDEPGQPPTATQEAADEAEDAPKVHAAEVAQQPPISTAREEGASRPVDDDEASRALEDALRALSELGVQPGDAGAAAGDGTTDADMKLVEEFVTSLGESLSGLSGPDILSATGRTAGGGPSEPSEKPVVEKLVESIVGHLLSEDVLRGPMLQMRLAYAKWLPQNEGKLSSQDATRFKRQQDLVEQICNKYEQGVGVTEIMDLLALMQETGAPPDDVMSQLASDGALDGIMEKLGGMDAKK